MEDIILAAQKRKSYSAPPSGSPRIVDQRAGVIPYTVDPHSGEVYLAVCVDRDYGEITDAGGAADLRESLPAAAIRELFEESAGLFDFREAGPAALHRAPARAVPGYKLFFLKIQPDAAERQYGFPDALPMMFSAARSAFEVAASLTAPTPRVQEWRSSSGGTPPRSRCPAQRTSAPFRVFLENSAMYWISLTDFQLLTATHTRGSRQRNLHLSRVPLNAAAQPRTAEALQALGAKRKPVERHPFIYDLVRSAALVEQESLEVELKTEPRGRFALSKLHPPDDDPDNDPLHVH